MSDDPRLCSRERRIKEKRNMVKLGKTSFKRLGLQIGRIEIEYSDSGVLQAKGKF